jgi:hypothetical protein
VPGAAIIAITWTGVTTPRYHFDVDADEPRQSRKEQERRRRFGDLRHSRDIHSHNCNGPASERWSGRRRREPDAERLLSSPGEQTYPMPVAVFDTRSAGNAPGAGRIVASAEVITRPAWFLRGNAQFDAGAELRIVLETLLF